MTRMSTDDLVTLIDVFTVEPVHQRRLLGILVDATEVGMRRLPGVVSATLRVSADGARVANDARRRSQEHLAAMTTNPEAAGTREAARIATAIEPHLYRVAHAATAAGGDGVR